MIRPSDEQSCNTHECVKTYCRNPGSVDYVYDHEAYYTRVTAVGNYYNAPQYNWSGDYITGYKESICYNSDLFGGDEDKIYCNNKLTSANHIAYYVQIAWVFCPCGSESVRGCCVHHSFDSTTSSWFYYKIGKNIDFCNGEIPISRTHGGYRYSLSLKYCGRSGSCCYSHNSSWCKTQYSDKSGYYWGGDYYKKTLTERAIDRVAI